MVDNTSRNMPKATLIKWVEILRNIYGKAREV